MSYMLQKQRSQVPTTLNVFVSRLSQMFIWLLHLWQYSSSNRTFGICEKGNPAHQVPVPFLMIFVQKRFLILHMCLDKGFHPLICMSAEADRYF